MAEDIFKKLKDLPENVQDYLLSDELADANAEILKKYNLQDKKDVFFDILNQLFLKEISVESLPALIFSKMKIKDDKVIKMLSEDVAKKILNHVADYLEIQKPKKDDTLADKAIKKFNFQFDEAGRGKFSEIVETFLSNVRTKLQFKNTLTKPLADGGLQMAHELADDVAEFLASYSRLEPVIAKSEEKKKEKSPPAPLLQRGEEKKIPPLTPPLITRGEKGSLPPLEKEGGGGFLNPPQPSLSEGGSRRPVPPKTKIEVAPPSVIPALPSVIPATTVIPDAEGIIGNPVNKAGIQSPPTLTKKDIDFSREEKEAVKQKSKIEKIRVAASKLLSVTEGVQNALAELNYTFPSSELQERLKSIIDARVRNVRTSIQTFDKLTQDIPSGGLGFSKLEADKVSLILNKYLEEKNKDIYGSKLAEIKAAEDEEKRKNEERARLAEEAEKQKLDARFVKLIGKSVEVQSSKFKIQSEHPPSEKGDRGGFINPPQPSLSKGGSGRPAPSIPNSKSPIINQKSEIFPPPQPVLEDIKFTPKLAGPLEEIGRLTLDDFRKLSGDPKEAILKIKDKLQLLRGESYKKYQQGIEAWKKSPLYGEYVKIISQSLTAGSPLEDVLKGGQTLTKEEFDGIINSRIGE